MTYVMLVEDDPVTLKINCGMLKKIGCKVDCACNGAHAIAICLNNYDLIILDCGLPDMDGFQIAENIRSLEKINKIPPRPIIMLSAYTLDQELRHKCELASINNFINKPIDSERLQQLLFEYATDF